MLNSLIIENIALIDKLRVDFGPGLNILSGETGAGKSIIIDSVNLVLGERADKALIKSGAERAIVEAEFDIGDNRYIKEVLKEHGFETEDGIITLSRELHANGKNVCRVCGRLANLSILKQVSETLMDMHGQHEHQYLLDKKNHIQFLDSFGASKINILKEETTKLFEELSGKKKLLKSGFGDEAERERKTDILKWQINEIEASNVYAGEESELISKRKIMQNAEKVSSALNFTYSSLYEGEEGTSILFVLKQMMDLMSDIALIDEKYKANSEKLKDVYYLLDEMAIDLRTLKDEDVFDITELERLEKRLDIISDLKRKYGGSEDAILAFLEAGKEELFRLQNSDRQIEELEADIKKLGNELLAASKKLSEERQTCAKVFDEQMQKQLVSLGMEKAQFETRFYRDENSKAIKLSKNGMDDIEFMFSANAGQPMKPLGSIASGGEISRLMLAIKIIGIYTQAVDVMVFDEIDTGISGRIAQAVAQKLAMLASKKQVICVTHLAQIACMADRHFLIEKESDELSTRTNLILLEKENICDELARISSGTNITSASLVHAREMLKEAEEFKKSIRT